MVRTNVVLASFEADVVARPDKPVHPVDYGAILVPDGWLLLAGAALAGNFAVAVVHRSVAYHSLGASTAIFAGLGLLTGRAIRVAGRQPRRWLGPFAPLWAGISLLALYGAGGLEVDVLAHLTGFLAGVGLGFAFAYSSSSSPKHSRLFGSFWGRNQK